MVVSEALMLFGVSWEGADANGKAWPEGEKYSDCVSSSTATHDRFAHLRFSQNGLQVLF